MNHSPLNYALWLLGRRDRSIGEIRKKLEAKECSVKEIDEALAFLCHNNFLNDDRFAKNYIQNQLIIKPIGKYQLKMKLKRKLIPEEKIDKALSESELDEGKLAEIATEKWLKGKCQILRIKYQDDARKIKENLSRHLISRGFGWEIVKNVLEKTNLK